MDEGWGESCTGSLTVEGDNLTCLDIQAKEGYYLGLAFGYNEEEQTKEFKAKFFPDGLPEFTAKIIETNYYGVFVGDQLVYKHFAYPEKKAKESGVKKLEIRLKELSEQEPVT